MPISVSNEKFEVAHHFFTQYVLSQSKGVPFTDFQHPFLVDDEIAFKWRIYSNAKKVLCLNKWKQWIKSPGEIIRATRQACLQSASENLLEHRYGLLRSSESALYKVKGLEQIRGLEDQLFRFFCNGPSTPAEFGPRFDALANYLRENQLGCKWSFLAYLAFLLSPQTYFPILPSRFDALLRFYGIEETITGYVSWERYSILLELAEVLKSKLAMYGQPNAIEIQSYMETVAPLPG